MALVATRARRCRTCGCTDDDCAVCIKRTGEPCFWAEDDLCSACRIWRPLHTLQPDEGHVFIREANGDCSSWRWLRYRRGSGTPYEGGGRWQKANEYGFRNARLPELGEWAPSPMLTPQIDRERTP